jgi:broad specificity phosphatase PhoE
MDIPKEIPKTIPKPRLRVFLVRHGEVEDHQEGRLNGHKDVALSELGEKQMAGVAKELCKRPIRAVYCSDLYRARKGAELVAKKLKLKVHALPELREIDFGEMSGLGWREVLVRMGGNADKLINWVDNRFPGGENLIDLRDRVMPAYQKIIQKENGEVAIFAHGGTNRMIIFSEFNLDYKSFFNFEQSYACVNILDYFQVGMKVLKLMNGSNSCMKIFEPI